jgi:hypothetical protein
MIDYLVVKTHPLILDLIFYYSFNHIKLEKEKQEPIKKKLENLKTVTII